MKQLPVTTFISRPHATTLRDWAAVGFRRGRLMVFTFSFIFLSVFVMTLLSTRKYEAELKILVNHERVEPLVTPDDKAQMASPEVTEQDLNSEVELLRSRDLLSKVLIATGTPAGDPVVLDRALAGMDKNLKVEPMKRTKLIRITYRSTTPLEAERVLQTLSRLYFEKHLEVHRPPGALGFFQAQTDQYRKQLKDAESAMTKFGVDRGVVEAPLSREIAVRKQNEFEADLQQTRALVSETEQRIRALEQQQATTAPRLTTEVKTSGNPLLIQQLQSTLLSLELRRTELLSKYSADYRPVQEVEAQIAQARETLENAQKNPIREETTDRDATHEWLRNELAKSRSDLKAFQAKVAATEGIVATYRDQARKLDKTEIERQDLVRKAKTAEENYMLYFHKQEEARISNALDQRRIVNVSVAQPPSAGSSPASPRWLMNLALGFMLALFASVALALAVDYMDCTFRTPNEVEGLLNVPVFAALPAEGGSGEGI